MLTERNLKWRCVGDSNAAGVNSWPMQNNSFPSVSMEEAYQHASEVNSYKVNFSKTIQIPSFGDDK